MHDTRSDPKDKDEEKGSDPNLPFSKQLEELPSNTR